MLDSLVHILTDDAIVYVQIVQDDTQNNHDDTQDIQDNHDDVEDIQDNHDNIEDVEDDVDSIIDYVLDNDYDW
jgi:hypothetical protein